MTPEERKMFEEAVIDGLAKGADDPIGLEMAKEANRYEMCKSAAHLFADDGEGAEGEEGPTDEDMEDAPSEDDAGEDGDEGEEGEDYPEHPGMF